LGSVERAIIAIASGRSRTAAYLARRIYHTRPISAAQLSSVRRALRRLAGAGLVRRESALPNDEGRARWIATAPGSVLRTVRQAIRRVAREAALQELAVAPAIGRDICGHCDRLRMPEGYDACLGRLPGVASACCGHGERDGYVRFESGLVLHGRWEHIDRPRMPEG
jgi:hypothetical protein